MNSKVLTLSSLLKLSLNGICIVYKPHELKVLSDWPPEVYANRLFRGRWHHVSTFKENLDVAKPCLIENCSELQEETVWVNIWGSVYNLHVCSEHAKHYKKYTSAAVLYLRD